MLWLGANVMLEYDINDAKELLGNNKENAIKSLEDVREQMGKFVTKFSFKIFNPVRFENSIYPSGFSW